MSLEMEGQFSKGKENVGQKSDLEMMRDMVRTLSSAVTGLEMAIKGRGEIKSPDAQEIIVLESMLESVRSFQENISERPISSEIFNKFATAMITVRSQLSKYLSEAQRKDLFGPENLA